MWEIPKIRGTFLRVPIIRTIAFFGSILGSSYFGKLPCLDNEHPRIYYRNALGEYSLLEMQLRGATAGLDED